MPVASFYRASWIALSIAAASTTAHADDAVTPYVGIGAGQTSFGFDSEECTRATGMTCDIESSDSGMKIYAGASFGQKLSVEATYHDFGTLEGTVSGGIAIAEEQTAVSLSVLGTTPFNENVGGIFKLGYYSSTLDATVTGPGGSVPLSDTSRGFMLGAGLNVNFNHNVGIRLEYEHLVNAGDSETDVGMASASLRLMF